MITIQKMKDTLTKAILTLKPNEEFDTKMLSDLLKSEHGFTFPFVTIRNILQHMNLSRRHLTKDETEQWRRQHGSQPKVLYKRHSGQSPNNYERGVKAKMQKRPTVAELQTTRLNDEECTTCPEWDTCQGLIVPCPRYPDKEIAPTNQVMKLEDF